VGAVVGRGTAGIGHWYWSGTDRGRGAPAAADRSLTVNKRRPAAKRTDLPPRSGPPAELCPKRASGLVLARNPAPPGYGATETKSLVHRHSISPRPFCHKLPGRASTNRLLAIGPNSPGSVSPFGAHRRRLSPPPLPVLRWLDLVRKGTDVAACRWGSRDVCPSFVASWRAFTDTLLATGTNLLRTLSLLLPATEGSWPQLSPFASSATHRWPHTRRRRRSARPSSLSRVERCGETGPGLRRA
jgi:hypothetical protein